MGFTVITYHKTSMDSTTSEIWSIFSQVYSTQPLHHAVIRPLYHLMGRGSILEDTENDIYSFVLGFFNTFAVLSQRHPYSVQVLRFFTHTSSAGLRLRQCGSNLLAWRTWMAHLMLRWWSWLVTFRNRRSFCKIIVIFIERGWSVVMSKVFLWSH